MKKSLLFCAVLAFIPPGLPQVSLPANSPSDFYTRGQQAKEKGQWQQAMQIWLAAKDSLSREHVVDPRIGFAYMELATSNAAEPFYGQASEMYMWSLSCMDVAKYKDDFAREVAFTSPLLTREEHERWQELLKKKSPQLVREMKAFWVQKDVIPTTPVNERLLEHWQRIAYAREHFTKDKNTVYGTDDRGLVLVKYGSPDQTYSGKFGLDQQEIMRWLDDFLLRQEVQRFNNNPDFELWMYSNGSLQPATLFLFGKKSGYGKFGLRYGVEDFIPDRAFARRNTKTTLGLLPGTMLQLMYYRELINVNKFFLDRYRELEARWSNARAAGDLNPNYDVLLGLLNHYKSIDQRRVNFEYLQRDRTNLFEGLEKLYINAKIFRYLDVNRTSRLTIFVVSGDSPVEIAQAPQFFRKAIKTKFKNRHILIPFDGSWDRQEEVVVYPAVHKFNTSVFLRPNGQIRHYVVSAEKVILDVRRAQLKESDIPDTAKVIGLNSLVLDSAPPLAVDSAHFEVSDLIVGQKVKPEVREAFDYPFPVMPRDPVKSSDALPVYFEAYNLRLGKKRQSNLEVQCTLLKRFEKADKKPKTVLKKTFKFNTSASDLKESVLLDIKGLKGGRYGLVVDFKDKHANEKRRRSATLQIAESL